MKKVDSAKGRRSYATPFNWLDNKLERFVSPQLGPWEESAPSEATCPVCGHDMAEHVVDRSKENQVLHCPAPPLANYERDPDAPLNELGMPKHKTEQL
ncbi:hypothetical protein [Cryobacterium sp. BB307]|uniref:hypothetical protein n=1 Tax=Cryobacterium sp. BB307 TaxID=2716317 RepID=UPI0014461BDF|nr:hypothetical protein [Cryobacterium sp. BB307]